MVVEGINDIEFLRRISRILHRSDRSLPDLAGLEREERLVMLPFGGGNVSAWTDRLAPLDCPELHLYDREAGGESRCRLEAARQVNARANCRAFVMAKRSLENYLHPRALQQSAGLNLRFGDHDPVAELVAQCRFTADEPSVDWQSLSRRAQKRLGNTAKRWLNTRAVEAMTPELLSKRDPHGEVVTWLQTIAAMTA